MKFPKITHFFLRLNFGIENVTNPVLVEVNLPPHYSPGGCIIIICFDEWG
jgi:hypothetical protein